MVTAGSDKFHFGADEEAVARFRRSLKLNPNHPVAQFYLAAALAQFGRQQEAQVAVGAGLALIPTFTLTRVRAGAQSDNPAYLRQRERLIDGMRKAGVPEECG
jgi:predicted Zn-dependent protease